MRILKQKEEEKNVRGERIFLSAFPFLLVSWFGFHFPFRTKKNKDSSNFKGKFCVAMDEISLHVEDNDDDDDDDDGGGDDDDDVFYECSLWPGL